MKSKLSVVGLIAALFTTSLFAGHKNRKTWEKVDDQPHREKYLSHLSTLAGQIYLQVLKKGLNRSSIDPTIIRTQGNRILNVLEGGEEIFGEYKRLISEANSEVLITTFVWNNDEVWHEVGNKEPIKVDAAKAIGEGLIAAQERFSKDKPLLVKITANQIVWSPNLIAKNIYDSILDWEEMGLDREKVKIEIGLYRHRFFGNNHSKYIVVDGEKTVVTGANVQANNNFDERNWHDTGVSLDGPAAYSIMKDYDESWYAHVTTYKCYKKKKRKFLFFGPKRVVKKCKRIRKKRKSRLMTGNSASHGLGGVNVLVLTQEAKGHPNNGVDSPQDQAWIAAMKYAKKRVYVLTPNINDDAFIKGMTEAASRGIDVRLITSKGFNKSRLGGVIGTLAGTGGHNAHVLFKRMIPKLKKMALKSNDPSMVENLKIRWFGIDGESPIEGNAANASHAKVMIVDDLVITGSGNMDTFAWNNSREMNILIDSAEVTQQFLDKIYLPDWENSVPVSPPNQ